ncbi:MAG: N,N'-diacetyllegionaminate synthase [Arenicella sp.]|jgi:N,N'-diacetyllegionaminate synthase
MKNILKPYIIGETAFHHEGEEQFAKDLIANAMDLGLDAIKFHLLLDLDDYMAHDHEAIDILRPWCFSGDQWDGILQTAKNIDIILMCNDVKSVEYAISTSYDIRAIEIHATGLNDIFLLEKAAQFSNTVILGVGGSSLDEIDYAINYLKDKGKADIFLMHGFQNYPTDFKDIKLERMNKLSVLFNLPMGYADHTDPADANNEYISCLGVANGHYVIEKHFTHQFGEKRIDSQAAVSIDQMKKVKEIAQITFETLGKKDSLVMAEAELKYGNTGPMKKAIVAKVDIASGTEITVDNISFKRTNDSSSIRQNELYKVLGNKTKIDIKKDAIIDLSNVEFSFNVNDTSQFNNTQK